MTIADVVSYINTHPGPTLTPEMDALVLQTCARAHRLTAALNGAYHEIGEIQAILSEITGEAIDPDFNLFPPFYTDFGRNLHFGRHVFVNAGCHFQDQGGIFIGDNVLIGHNAVLATIDHDLNPYSRRNHYAPIHIGDRVWIGANAVITKGVTIGENSVIAAGAVVTKDVPANCVAGGVPARVLKKLDPTEWENRE